MLSGVRGTAEAGQVIDFLKIKRWVPRSVRTPVSASSPSAYRDRKRLVRRAIQYAIENDRKSVTLVHKGNIQKFTEGAFRDWGYEVAKEEFPEACATEEEVGSDIPEGKVIVKDRIADSMFQQVLLRPTEYDVIATTNLNGDYLSDACAAQVGGLGMAPGANIGDEHGVFEATHGTAPKYADQDVINPSSVILSGAMMFRFMGWKGVADRIEAGITRTIANKTVTYDLHRQMAGAKKLKTSEFAAEIANNMADLAAG